MGKGTIISHLGEGKYEVDVHHQSSRPEKMVKYYHDLYLTTFEDELLAADDAVDAAKNAFYNESQKPNGLDDLIPILAAAIQEYTWLLALGESAQGGTDKINEARDAVKKAMEDCAKATSTLEYLRGELQLALNNRDEVIYRFKEYARLEDLWQLREDKAIAIDTQDLWCIDLSETTTEETCGGYPSIPNGVEVGLIDIDCIGDEETTKIDTAYPSGLENKYDASKYGMLEHKLNQVPEGWFYNMSIYPGMVTWRPKWSFAEITKIDYLNNNCTVERYASWTAQNDALPYPHNWDSRPINEPVESSGHLIIYEDIPIKYMSCDSVAFRVGDAVVVTTDLSGKPLEVIGFAEKPRSCAAVYVSVKGTSYGWFESNNEWAEVSREGGTLSWSSKSSCHIVSWWCSSEARMDSVPWSIDKKTTASHLGSDIWVDGVKYSGPELGVAGACITDDSSGDLCVFCITQSITVTGYMVSPANGKLTYDKDYVRMHKKKLSDVINETGTWVLIGDVPIGKGIYGIWHWNESATQICVNVSDSYTVNAGMLYDFSSDGAMVEVYSALNYSLVFSYIGVDFKGDEFLEAWIAFGKLWADGSRVDSESMYTRARTLVINGEPWLSIVAESLHNESSLRDYDICSIWGFIYLDLRDLSNWVGYGTSMRAGLSGDDPTPRSNFLIINGEIVATRTSSFETAHLNQLGVGVDPGHHPDELDGTGFFTSPLNYSGSHFWGGVMLNSGVVATSIPTEWMYAADVGSASDSPSGDDTNLVPNGEFDNNANGWSLTDAEWYQQAVSINGAGSGIDYLQQTTNALIVGRDYIVKFKISNYEAGGIHVNLYGGVDGPYFSENGENLYGFTATATDANFVLTSHADGFVGTLDDISVELVSDTEMVTNGDFGLGDNGWTLIDAVVEDGHVVCNKAEKSTVHLAQKTKHLNVGVRYRVTFTVSGYVQGGIKVALYGGFDSAYKSSNGIFTHEFVSATTYADLKLQSGDDEVFIGIIDSVSVIAVGGTDELVYNGNFDSNADDWTLDGAKWVSGAINVNVPEAAVHLAQTAAAIVVGTKYRVTFDISNYIFGGILVAQYGGAGDSDLFSADGTASYEFTAITDESDLYLGSGIDGFIGTIDNVSVGVLVDDFISNGDFANGDTDWTLTSAAVNDEAVDCPDITPNIVHLAQTILAPTVGTYYQLSFIIKDHVMGEIGIANFAGAGSSKANLNGKHSVIFQATDTSSEVQLKSGAVGFIGTVDDISITVVGLLPAWGSVDANNNPYSVDGNWRPVLTAPTINTFPYPTDTLEVLVGDDNFLPLLAV